MQFLYASEYKLHTCHPLEHMNICKTSNNQYSFFSPTFVHSLASDGGSMVILRLVPPWKPFTFTWHQSWGKGLFGSPAQ